ncbi:hypothetical protein CAPTEDRAFT_206861 [Capitella teleta]|uniref:Chitin-binding type-2 domain-containing protein n=1 Tax=Capitella teleta TaxID=283909 RepID=R7TTB6_CAPTE|nr:hypothetical protein CAPTEDRAFT_206861 [Capitella teleta]|eukprot:ELT94260.1 hypothetical protein CAPTEDRAFT_206861 [Capitella teleta]
MAFASLLFSFLVIFVAKDCKKYYQCYHGQWASFTCVDPSTFDYESLACEPQENCFPGCQDYTESTGEPPTILPSAPCPGIENCTEGHNYADATSCFSYFHCINGELELRFCSGVTSVFDIYKLECAEPSEDIDCTYRCRTPGPSTEAQTTESLTTNTEHPVTDPCNRPPLCSSGDDPELVADPDDCKKYFQCLNNQWAHFTCPGDSTFDSKANTCANNHDNCFPTCPVYTGASTVSATRVPSDTCPGTTDNCTKGENYPDASSCLSYYVCEDGELQLKFCSAFTPVFDIHELECIELPADFNCEYRCKTAGPSTEQPTTKPETSSGKTSQATTTPSSSLDPCTRDEFCDEEAILPDPESCLHYYYCADGQWGRIKCPRGYLFDWSSAYCRDEEVICHPECPPKPTPVEPGLCEMVTSCVVGEKFADRASCIHFWECIESEGILERKMCGAQLPTYVFDIDQRECVQPDVSFDCEVRCLV